MKTITFTFTLFILGISNFSFAQLITISETNQMPQVGDTVHYVDANTFGFDADGTGPVTDVLWDLATLMNAGTTVDYYYIDATTTTQTAWYPSANIARENSSEAGYFYYETDGNDMKRWGWYAGNANYGIYNTGATEFHFPITAGDNYSNSYHGEHAPFGFGEDSVVIDMGQVSAQADMQGTLILPTGTFTNVLRIHLQETFHIKAYMVGTAATDNVITDDYYYWFHDTILQPVMVYGKTFLDGTEQSEVLRYQPVSPVVTGKVGDLVEKNSLVYPNPSKGFINIDTKECVFVKIFDLQGRMLAELDAQDCIDINHLPGGSYIVKLIGENESKVFKIVLDK